MTNSENTNYKDRPDKYICLGENVTPLFPLPDSILALGLSIMIFDIGNDQIYYLDVDQSQKATGYSRWLDMLSDKEREKELADDFVGGGCH